MSFTHGINHLGLSVKNLNKTRDFFTNTLGWEESGYDPSYPRTAVSDGKIRLTLWQVDSSKRVEEFDRRKNIGLHHLALEVATEAKLDELYEILKGKVKIEFAPELLGAGPRKHMMCCEPREPLIKSGPRLREPVRSSLKRSAARRFSQLMAVVLRKKSKPSAPCSRPSPTSM